MAQRTSLHPVCFAGDEDQIEL